MIDRGSGIDPKSMNTIFNPFFTTKPDGVGLGLAIVSKIVDEHGGKIAVESEPGKGSVFRVSLPMDPAQTPARHRHEETNPGCRRRRKTAPRDRAAAASAGFEVDKAGTAEEGLKLVDRADLVLTDLRLPGMDGLELLATIRRQNAQVPVIVMTAFGTVETAVEAMKAGATDFLLKPFSLDHLMPVVNKALEVRALRDENRQLKEELGRRYEFDNIIGRSEPMQEIFATIKRVAPTRATVLLAGESGVGKDLIARAIHFHSPRRDRPLVKINCTAIPENLMESELFGYEKGAFTGANTTKPGKFEQADTGTVFLDEIGDVPALDSGEAAARPAGARIRAAGQQRHPAHRRARDRRHQRGSARGARAGHLSRGSVLPAERGADEHPAAARAQGGHPVLANHFVQLAPDSGSRVESITDAAMEADGLSLAGQRARTGERDRAQPGDGGGHGAGRADIKLETAPRPRNQGDALPAGRHEPRPERAGIIREALRRADGNKSQAARLLGLTRNALRYRLTQMGLES